VGNWDYLFGKWKHCLFFSLMHDVCFFVLMICFQWSGCPCCKYWLALCSLLSETWKMQNLWWYGSQKKCGGSLFKHTCTGMWSSLSFAFCFPGSIVWNVHEIRITWNYFCVIVIAILVDGYRILDCLMPIVQDKSNCEYICWT